ncbi:interleukin-17F-like [Fundulus heteroclitus]|uniref:interleukin 17a/f3 n=1 Tax=Fundulus heteroclitus TaxID=8078 RepID=UPI00165A2824|nr:interleukin 17a/f3 [Fundulus heteroclitus]XP_036003597.1 interleukin-17F-like [Fundulus heteroclitus]
MLLVTRVFLLLGFASVLPAAGKKRLVPLQLGQDISPRGKTVKLVLDPSVNSYLSFRSASNVADLSLSPWTYIDSFNSSRLPERISQANCSTSGCLNIHGGGEDLTLEAKPIKYQVLVLYRSRKERKNKKAGKKAKKKYVFLLGTEEITVGCTCVRPSVVPQQ